MEDGVGAGVLVAIYGGPGKDFRGVCAARWGGRGHGKSVADVGPALPDGECPAQPDLRAQILRHAEAEGRRSVFAKGFDVLETSPLIEGDGGVLADARFQDE